MGQEWNKRRNQKVSGNNWKWTHNSPKLTGHSEGSPEREVHSDTGLLKKDRNIRGTTPGPCADKKPAGQNSENQPGLKETATDCGSLVALNSLPKAKLEH